MLLESDVLIAYFKKEDWLKKTAEKIIEGIEKRRLENVQISTEVFHELYYVFSDYAPAHVIMANEARLATIKNLEFIEARPETYISSINIMETYKLTSIFDAIYAATALGVDVPDRTIISTEHIYDKIKGIRRVEPRELQF